ncbi:MAG: intermembrane transport protein PqiB [Halioglobus sp.]
MTTEQADVSQGRSFSGIWIIPLIALLLGVYMVVHTWLTEGPEIEIAFKTASGLTQGKTKIKYRNVDMGLVEEVYLNDNLDGVIAKVKLERQALSLLRDDTRFWVVTARIGAGGISGLDTVLSGAYIQLAPGKGVKGKRKYVALEQPPLTPSGAPGLRLRLVADRASSVSTGDSVLFNSYKVGRVESMKFDPKDRKAHYTLFIDAPYHELVDSQSRFWDVSGISMSAGANGFTLQTGSMDTVLLGGVAFGLPKGVRKGDAVEQDTEFELYANFEEIQKNPYRYGQLYVVSFSQSIKGLAVGAPVEYRGITLGKVEKILLKESIEHNVEMGAAGRGADIPVLIYLEPGRLGLSDQASSVESMHQSIVYGVQNGMRASLETGSLLTGAKYISINYFDGAEEASMGEFMKYRTIPAIETGLGQIEQKLNAVLDKINALPLEDTMSGANTAIATLNQTLASLHTILESQSTQQLPEQLDKTLQDLRNALQGFSPESEAYQSINSSLLRLNRTLGNMESLTRTLSGQPNAALMPSSPLPDPIPEAQQ